MVSSFIYYKNSQNLVLIYFVLFSLLFLSKSAETFLSFKYPYAITIKDEKILVIHQDGVTICNPNLTSVIKQEITFEGTEKINTEESLSKVTTLYEKQYGDEYIIALINDYIYIFDEDGNFKYKSSNSIHYDKGSIKGDYYTLVGAGYLNDYFYYIIGFIYNKKIYLYGYKYDLLENSNTQFYQISGYNQRYSTSSSYYIYNKALSCLIVEHYNLGEVLLCVFLIYYSYDSYYIIAFEYFQIYENSIKKIDSTSYNKYFQYDYNAICFKAISNNAGNKIVIAGYCNNGLGIFSVYNINSNSIETRYIVNHYLRKQYHNLQFRYFDHTDEFIMT